MLLIKEPKHPERHLLVERIFDTILYAAAFVKFCGTLTAVFVNAINFPQLHYFLVHLLIFR